MKSWMELIAVALRPTRPLLSQCRARARARVEADSLVEGRRRDALAACRARIELARTTVFEAGDGIVDGRMTALEREWLAIERSAPSPEQRTLALWNEIAPRRWSGRLRFAVTGDPAADRAAVVTLASDPDGVERAEACARAFADALSTWGPPLPPSLPGAPVGSSVTWRIAAELAAEAHAARLLGRPLRALDVLLASTYGGEALRERALRLQRDVFEAARRSPALSTSEGLAADIALVASFDLSWRACALDARRLPAGCDHAGRAVSDLANPARLLTELWKTGYVVCGVDAAGVTLGAMTAGLES